MFFILNKFKSTKSKIAFKTTTSKKIKKVWRLRTLILLIIEASIAALIFWLSNFFAWPIWLTPAFIIFILFDFVTEMALIPYRYHFWRYQVTNTDVEIEAGFFFHKQTAIPITRIQNVTLEVGPLFQYFHLQTVKVETAAAGHDIAGVSPETANKLKKQIIKLTRKEDSFEE